MRFVKLLVEVCWLTNWKFVSSWLWDAVATNIVLALCTSDITTGQSLCGNSVSAAITAGSCQSTKVRVRIPDLNLHSVVSVARHTAWTKVEIADILAWEVATALGYHEIGSATIADKVWTAWLVCLSIRCHAHLVLPAWIEGQSVLIQAHYWGSSCRRLLSLGLGSSSKHLSKSAKIDLSTASLDNLRLLLLTYDLDGSTKLGRWLQYSLTSTV